MGEWLTEAAPGLAIVLLLLLREREAQAVPMDWETFWRAVQVAAALSPVLIGGVLYLLGKHFPGRKEVVSASEVDDKIAAALKDERANTISRLELENVMGTYGRERDKFVEQVSFAGREAANTALLSQTATLRERIERVEDEVATCRTDMDGAKDKANEAASAVAQLQTKVGEMDRRISESIAGLREVLIAKLEAIESRMERAGTRTRKGEQ